MICFPCRGLGNLLQALGVEAWVQGSRVQGFGFWDGVSFQLPG